MYSYAEKVERLHEGRFNCDFPSNVIPFNEASTIAFIDEYGEWLD